VYEQGAGKGGDGLEPSVVTLAAELVVSVSESAVGVVGASLATDEVVAQLGFVLSGADFTTLASGAAHGA